VAVKLPLSILDWSRSIAGEPDIKLANRYFEQDPTNQENQCSLISRPGLRKWKTVGSGPIRCIYSQPGSFSDALFVVSGDTVYKIGTDETTSTIGTLGTSTGAVSMAATDSYLFVADGAALYSYTTNDYARGTLTVSGAISAGETVKIGSVYYKFATDVSTGADGTSGTPWLVLIGGTNTDTLANLLAAINNSGEAGTAYSLALTGNPDAVGSSSDATTLKVRSALPGTSGNSISTTETMVNGAWGGTTLSGGGGSSFATVSVPDGSGIISVGVIISFTICLVAQGADPAKNGRFYWIWPGENTIAELDFATAERSPDTAYAAIVLGDQIWFPGQNSIEVWNPTGEADAPFQRQQGRLFERGAWAGTVTPLGEAMMLTDANGNVWEVTDAPQLVSTPGIAQRIREAVNAERAA
jgi:hypothetical protein